MKTFSGRAASQDDYELQTFINLLRDHGVKKYLEIGARHGDTFYDVVCSLPPGSLGVAVDFPGGLWGTKKSEKALRLACQELIKKGYKVAHIFGDSTQTGTIEIVKSFGTFDAIFIDGDHTYQGIKKDWENYSGMAPIVALHDIVGTGQREKVFNSPVDVPRFWGEIKSSLDKTLEIVSFGSAMGIGVWLSQ